MAFHLEVYCCFGAGRRAFFLPKIQGRIPAGLCWLLDGLQPVRAGFVREKGKLAHQVCGGSARRRLADKCEAVSGVSWPFGFCNSGAPLVEAPSGAGLCLAVSGVACNNFESSGAPGHDMRVHWREVQIRFEKTSLWKQRTISGRSFPYGCKMR